MHVTYHVGEQLSPEDFIDVLERSGLAERRPAGDRARVERMLQHANLLVTARVDGTLIGVARALTDYSFCCYLSDLAVDREFQSQGVGRELIRQVQTACGPECMLLLLAAPAAQGYYPHVGFEAVSNGWIIHRQQ